MRWTGLPVPMRENTTQMLAANHLITCDATQSTAKKIYTFRCGYSKQVMRAPFAPRLSGSDGTGSFSGPTNNWARVQAAVTGLPGVRLICMPHAFGESALNQLDQTRLAASDRFALSPLEACDRAK